MQVMFSYVHFSAFNYSFERSRGGAFLINDSLGYLELFRAASGEAAALFENMWSTEKEGKHKNYP